MVSHSKTFGKEMKNNFDFSLEWPYDELPTDLNHADSIYLYQQDDYFVWEYYAWGDCYSWREATDREVIDTLLKAYLELQERTERDNKYTQVGLAIKRILG